MLVKDHTKFADAYKDAVDAVLNAVATTGDDRRKHCKNARLAVREALRDACNGDEWHLAECLRRSIRDVEAA